MGHTWRDMNPGDARKHDEFMNRLQKVRERLGNLSLSVLTDFTVTDLSALLKITLQLERPQESDLEYIEQKLKEIETHKAR